MFKKGRLKFDTTIYQSDTCKEASAVRNTLHQKYQISYATINNWLGSFPRYESDILYLKHHQNIIKKNVKWYLKHRHYAYVDNAIENYIIELLLSNISASQIAYNTGVKRPVISYLRNGKRSIDNLSLSTAQSLVQYYKTIKTWASWEDVINAYLHYNYNRNFWMLPVNRKYHTKQALFLMNGLISRNTAKHLQFGSWNTMFNDIHDIDNNLCQIRHCKIFGIIINQNVKNKWYPINNCHISKELEHVCNNYTSILPSKRTLSDEAYMLNDLQGNHKAKQLLNNN